MPALATVTVSLLALAYSIRPLRSVGSRSLRADDGHRHFGDEADIFEGVQRVVGELAVERGAGRHADVVEQQRVAVRLGAGDAAGAQRAAGAADILDDDLLAEILGHGFGDQARDRVGRAAGRERHDDGDRAVGIGLGGSRKRGRRECRGGKQSCHEFHYWFSSLDASRLCGPAVQGPIEGEGVPGVKADQETETACPLRRWMTAGTSYP